jgi:hypothetical protein
MKYQSEAIWPVILEQIANGHSLSAVLRQPNMPSYGWAKLQLRQNRELRAQYDEAVQDRADVLAEQIEAIADEECPADLDGPSKTAWTARQRLRFDARRWASSKLAPRRYGDRMEIDAPTYNLDIKALLEKRERRLREICCERPITIEGEVTAEKPLTLA